MNKRIDAGMTGVVYDRTNFRRRGDGELLIFEINPNRTIFCMPEENDPAGVPITFDPEGQCGSFARVLHSVQIHHEMHSES